MDVKFYSERSKWVNPAKTTARDGEKNKTNSMSFADMVRKADQFTISDQGMQSTETRNNCFTEMQLAIDDSDIKALAEAAKKQSGTLTVNWKETVDPGGKIYSRTYAESILRQFNEALTNIENYYSDAHQENLSFDKPYNHIVEKYNLTGSQYFRSDMSSAERDMAFHQERALLWGGHLTMNDPYALASHGGVLNIKDVDRIAMKEANDKVNELIRARQSESKGRLETIG